MAGIRSDLPHHLVVEILSWLPFSSVLSLRCVCKAWNALTRDPFFVDLHRRRAAAAAGKSRASYVYILDEPSLAHLSYEPAYTGARGTRVTTLSNLSQEEETWINIKSHCRGLTCISLVRGEEKDISVHNLATGEFRVLATLPADARVSFHLGFDRCTNRYKLLHLGPSHRTWDEACDVGHTIYTLGDAPGAWRRLPNYDFPVGTSFRVTSWKGNPAWMRLPPSDGNRVQVVWFDMAREELLTMAGPKKGMLEVDETAVEIFPWWNDALAMAIHSERRAALEMWVLTDEDQSVWSLQWSIPLGDHPYTLWDMGDGDPYTFWDTDFKIVGPLPGGKLMLVASYINGFATVGPANSPGGHLKVVELPAGMELSWPEGIIPHLDTLVSLQDLWKEGQYLIEQQQLAR